MVSYHNWLVKTNDNKSVFLQGQFLTRDVYLQPPTETEVKVGVTWHLNRCLYGLNDPARQFYFRAKKLS